MLYPQHDTGTTILSKALLPWMRDELLLFVIDSQLQSVEWLMIAGFPDVDSR